MEIHDLNTKALTDPAYVAFDDGEDTYKTEFNDCVENAANAAVAAADLTENEVAFTSGDAASPTAWSSVPVLASGSTLATLFNRISTMIKNVRWLYSKLGTTDISSIGNGTVTGALSTLNGKADRFTTASIIIDTQNRTTFAFNNLNNINTSNMFKHGLLVWGVGSAVQSTGLSFVFVNADNTVTIKNISGTGRTLTGTVSNGVLTITADQTMYGGLKLIWLT